MVFASNSLKMSVLFDKSLWKKYYFIVLFVSNSRADLIVKETEMEQWYNLNLVVPIWNKEEKWQIIYFHTSSLEPQKDETFLRHRKEVWK